MIKIENFEVVGWEHAIRGMRNPMNSWDKSDSVFDYDPTSGCNLQCGLCGFFGKNDGDGMLYCNGIGPNDHERAMSLSNAGTDHRKFMRMIVVYLDITAPLYWWKEFDTYKVGTVANSCSTMHKIHEKEFTLEDFSCEHLIRFDDISDEDIMYTADDTMWSPHGILYGMVIQELNLMRARFLETNDKKYWWQMIQLLPSSYNQKRTVMLNYEVLANIYHSRKNHKLDEWRELCEWIEKLPYSELITTEKEAPSKLTAEINIDASALAAELADRFSRENVVTKEELEQIFKNMRKETSDDK